MVVCNPESKKNKESKEILEKRVVPLGEKGVVSNVVVDEEQVLLLYRNFFMIHPRR